MCICDHMELSVGLGLYWRIQVESVLAWSEAKDKYGAMYEMQPFAMDTTCLRRSHSLDVLG